jgi:hypothetical protein
MNEIIGICTVIATIIAAITYNQTVYKKQKEKRKYLLDEFAFIKKLNSQLLAQLNNYVIQNQCSHIFFIENQTFYDCIVMLNELEKTLETEDIDAALKINRRYLSGSEITTDNLIKDVEYWQNALFTIQASLKKLVK